MRCLHCHSNVTGDVCPQCGLYLPSLLRDVLPVGTYLDNRTYRIDDILGRGGFGITYQATHLALQDRVAIKELYPAQYATRESVTGQLLIPTDRQEDFKRELQHFKEEGYCLKDLQHPGVVRVRDMFEGYGTIYLVMQFVQGDTLRVVLDAQGGTGLSLEQVEKIVEQLVSILETIHRENIYHLDIKPENILLAAGSVILVDFGAARRKVSAGTQHQFDLNYAAPELFTRQEVGAESDLYELGVLVHELLTGTRPLSALDCLIQRKLPVLSPKLIDPWRELLERALVLQKDERPSSVRTWWETKWDRFPPITMRASPIPIPLPGFSDLDMGELFPSTPRTSFSRIPLPDQVPHYVSQLPPEPLFPGYQPPSTSSTVGGSGGRPLQHIPRVIHTEPAIKEEPRPIFHGKLLLLCILLSALVLIVLIILLGLAHP